MRNTIRSKVFLLDMDGVILRHPTVSKILGTRVNSFVRKNMNPFMDFGEAEKINNVLYKDFGHTVLGLQKVYDSNISVKDFCDYVYDKPFLKYIEILNRDEIFQEHSYDVCRFLHTCKEKGIPVFVFSNANKEWCRSVLQIMEAPSVLDTHIIGCDSPAYQSAKEVCLKPQKAAYTKTVQYVYKILSGKQELQFVYVDDQIQNLIPIMNNQYWKPVWFNTDKEKPELYTPSMSTVRTITQLYNFI